MGSLTPTQTKEILAHLIAIMQYRYNLRGKGIINERFKLSANQHTRGQER